MKSLNIMHKTATFSKSRKYRYTLWRGFTDLYATNYVVFVGLNPSAADEIFDDPTVRRCIRYAKDWGYDDLCMTNIFAFRATEPTIMMAEKSPIGRHNDFFLRDTVRRASMVVAAWGNDGEYLDRGRKVKSMLSVLSKLHYLKLTKNNNPYHPLYLKKNLKPIKWR